MRPASSSFFVQCWLFGVVAACALACSQPSAAQVEAGQTSESLKTPDSFERFPFVAPGDVDKTFVVQAGFQMQLIAAEPLVTDPVAMAIDEDGRAYVVEMNDYPYTNPKTHRPWQDNRTDQPIGRVRLLEDTDGNGTFDQSTVFAEGLSWPSGIVCYRGGVFVTATPDIWYLKDSDNNKIADVRQRVFTGFRKYNVQAVMNNPIWGLDNHIYVAGSSNGGSVVAMGEIQQAPITARGDFRIDPRTNSFQLQAGGARFGNTFDDWGNRFLCNIRNPAIHVVLDNRYLARNPSFAAPSAVVDVAESGDQMPVYRISPVEPWRDLRGRQWSADPTKAKTPRSELSGGGVFTSTSGITVYRGDAYPPDMSGNVFLGEVANNIIYRQTLKPLGNTFRAGRADPNVEFVASTDTWFRPVNLVNAPDGTLYVLDMYREFIEHPWSIPDDIHAKLDLRSGQDRGRIYRLAPSGFTAKPPPALGHAPVTELVTHLAQPSSWWRETAQRLLVERQDKSVVPLLRERLAADNPLAAVHALWTLVGLDSIIDEDVLTALDHPSPRVREHAVRVGEDRIAASTRLGRTIARLSQDDDQRVRLQVALTLGGVPSAEVVPHLATLAARDGGDPWMRSALCSSLPEHIEPLARSLVEDMSFASEAHASTVIEQLTAIIGVQGNAEAAARIVRANFNGSRATTAMWQGLGSGAKRKGRNLDEWLDGHSDHSAKSQLQEFFDHQLSIAEDASRSDEDRTAAIIRLSYGSFEATADRMLKLLEPLQPHSIQIAAVRGLASYKDDRVAGHLISRLRSFTPAVREEVFTALLARPERTLALLSAVQRGDLPAAQLGLARKTQLLSSPQPELKKLAENILSQSEEARASVIERYAVALTTQGDPARGRAVFEQHCAACHRAAGVGNEIGPHIETVRAWDRSKLLLNVLDPSREVAPQSMAYVIILSDGRVVNGLITDETASSLTVKRAGAKPEIVLREDIEQMSNTGVSLMPIGFEESISPTAMADLLAFLQSSPGKR